MKSKQTRESLVLLAFLAGLIMALGLVAVGIAVGSQPVRGLSLLILGAGVLAARREVAEVLLGLNAGPPRGEWVDAYFLGGTTLFGVFLAGSGAWLLVTALP